MKRILMFLTVVTAFICSISISAKAHEDLNISDNLVFDSAVSVADAFDNYTDFDRYAEFGFSDSIEFEE